VKSDEIAGALRLDMTQVNEILTKLWKEGLKAQAHTLHGRSQADEGF